MPPRGFSSPVRVASPKRARLFSTWINRTVPLSAKGHFETILVPRRFFSPPPFTELNLLTWMGSEADVERLYRLFSFLLFFPSFLKTIFIQILFSPVCNYLFKIRFFF